MLAKAETAYFAIADISGYTNFLAVELEHAQDIIADFMDTVVKGLPPRFGSRNSRVTPRSSTPWPTRSTVAAAGRDRGEPTSNSAGGCTTFARPRLRMQGLHGDGRSRFKFVVHYGEMVKQKMGGEKNSPGATSFWSTGC